MKRVHPSHLLEASKKVRFPRYDRRSRGIGIVHFGLGAFHRAHQALYTEEVLENFPGDWAICGVSMRSSKVAEQLNPQEGLYSCAVLEDHQLSLRVVGAIKEVLVAPQEPENIVLRVSNEKTQVITLSITEKGYCLKGSSGRLDLLHPDVRSDLESSQAPKTIYGFLFSAFALRKRENKPGLTVISCDNLIQNGTKLAAAMADFTQQKQPELWPWIERMVSFPSTMVDRIVPAVKEDDKKRISEILKLEDQGCVLTEPFTQWVIEKKFATPVPAWDSVGAQFVEDVAPYEEIKLRLLNGSHLAIAYLGVALNLKTVADVVDYPPLKNFVVNLMSQELAPTLPLADLPEIRGYLQKLLRRFSNRGLPHLTRQIAVDGSQKIPQRLLPALKISLERQLPNERIVFVIALWIRYLKGVDEQGLPYSIDDPLAEDFQKILKEEKPQLQKVAKRVLAIEEIFGDSLPRLSAFTERALHWVRVIEEKGVLAALSIVDRD